MGVIRVAASGELDARLLCEREDELRSLDRLLSEARQGRGGAIAVVGPAGIGKSRLLAAADAGAAQSGMERFVARAEPSEREFPFGLVLQLFERYVRRLSVRERKEVLAGAAGLAAGLFIPTGTGEGPFVAARGQLFPLLHGLYWLVVNLSERTPVLLLADDLHAADDPSVRFLLYLAQRLDRLPLALVIAARPGEPDAPSELDELTASPNVTQLRPAPLSAGAVGTLLRDQLEFPVDETFVAACREVTGGNPFLLHELLAALVAEGIDAHTAIAERVRSLTSNAVTQRLLLRLARQPRDAAAFARALAVLGDAAPLPLVAELADIDMDAAARALDTLARVEIARPLQNGERASFVHPLVRAALYEDLPTAERARAHARAASLLIDAGAPHEQVVPHVLRSRRGADARAADLLGQAAADAAGRGAPDAAATFLERALEEPLDADRRARLNLELARARLSAGEARAAEEAARIASTLACDPRCRAEGWLTLGRALYVQARHGEAAVAFDRGLAEVEESVDCELVHELRAALATAASMDASLVRSGVALSEVIVREQSPHPTLSERAVLAQLAIKRGFAAAPRDEVLPLVERAWGDGALLEAEGADGTIWTLITAALACTNYLERDVEICSAVLQAARASGSVLAFATASYCRIYPLWRLGRIDEAIADAETALDARRYGWEQHRGSAAAMLAHALIEKGALDAAMRALEPIDEPDMRTRVDYALMLEARARVSLARGNPQAALRDCNDAAHLFNDVFAMHAPMFERRPTEALAAAAIGDLSRARAIAEEMLEVTRAIGAPGMIGRALRVAGVIERGERALELLGEAVDVLEQVPPRLERVRALIDYGSALRRAGHRRTARSPLERALPMAISGGALALAERARTELATLGARPRKDLAARDRMTPSERRVAEMAAAGMTNKQIAQALFVTLKAVEGHLHQAYQKLGISGRSELPHALASLAAENTRVGP